MNSGIASGQSFLDDRAEQARQRGIVSLPAPRQKDLPLPHNESACAGEYARDVNLVSAADIHPEAISWLWPGWLAKSKVHVLGGAPGTGKTTLAMALAATLTTAGRWPDGTCSPAGNVVIWSGEDDPADRLVPRLIASGADLARIFFIGDVRDGAERRSFDPARDIDPLRRKLAEVGDVRLLIVDPLVSAVSGDSHKNAEVRRGLQPLADLAASMHCAMLGITHLSKGTAGRDPVERLTGSLAFGALARVVLIAAKQQEEGEDGRAVRLFCRAKSNIGADDGGFEYDLHQSELKTHPGVFASSVLWGEAVSGAARELLAAADATGDDGEGGSLADAKQFLADLLADGPRPTKTIKSDADGAGYSWATIRRAQKAIGADAVREGFGKGGNWVWRLPQHRCSSNPIDAQQKEVSSLGKVEHLCEQEPKVEIDL
jgi:putative DNA primase/helicase